MLNARSEITRAFIVFSNSSSSKTSQSHVYSQRKFFLQATTMSFASFRASSSNSLKACSKSSSVFPQTPCSTRTVSTSPYGRTHVWKKRSPVLPKPFVPHFPQRVIRADGSTFVHYTSSPRSVIHLTRDTTNHPLWNISRLSGESLQEDRVAGRLGRFNRRFDGIGGHGQDVDWMGEMTADASPDAGKEKGGSKTGKK